MSHQRWFRRFLFPEFPIRELPRMLALTVAGAMLGGTYGVIHDQITYTISPEYFTRLKFDQFAYGWLDLMSSLGVTDQAAFMKVCYIHNASYLGGILGTILAITFLARSRARRWSLA